MICTCLRRALFALVIMVVAGGLAHAAPSIAFLSPASVPAGTSAFALTIVGTDFQSGAVVSWNSLLLQTAFLGSNQLTATVPAGLASTAGVVQISVVNPGNVVSNSVTLVITAAAINITTANLPAGTAGTPYAATLSATGGTPPYTWSALSALPPGLLLNSTGTITGTPTASGTYSVSIRVTDSQQGTTSRSFVLTVTGVSITTAATLPAGTAGQPYTQALTATGGVPPYRWNISQGLPPGLTINSSTGVLSGTPTSAGAFSFTAQVTDSSLAVASQTFTLTINVPPLTITTVPPLFSGIVGTVYAQVFSASGGVPPYQWTILSGTTGGLTLDPNSGILQGTPQNVGTFTFTIQASDSRNSRVSQSFSVSVVPPVLTITTSSSLPAGTVGVNYTQPFSVTGGQPPYTWSLTSGAVPGLSFNAGSATLSGTPTAPGTFTFALQARDSSNLTAARSFTVTIRPTTLSITTATQLPDGTLGSTYAYTMTATGGVTPYTWSANGLPDGLAIDPNTGTISGTLGAASPAPFAVTVVDSTRAAATNQFRINVTLPAVPSISISGLPSAAAPADQFKLSIVIDSAFPAPISGQALLTFTPDVGAGDGTIQFSTGGTTANFTIPAGSTGVNTTAPLAIQTGTVAGTITILLRLQSGGLDVTPTPAPVVSTHIDQSAPVIQNTQVSRSGSTLSIQITGYSTAREITQANFTFAAAPGQTLQVSQVTVPVDSLFSSWFQDPKNGAYGSQFVFTQTFSIQGDINAVRPQNVTLTNRKGSVTASITQ